MRKLTLAAIAAVMAACSSEPPPHFPVRATPTRQEPPQLAAPEPEQPPTPRPPTKSSADTMVRSLPVKPAAEGTDPVADWAYTTGSRMRVSAERNAELLGRLRREAPLGSTTDPTKARVSDWLDFSFESREAAARTLAEEYMLLTRMETDIQTTAFVGALLQAVLDWNPMIEFAQKLTVRELADAAMRGF